MTKGPPYPNETMEALRKVAAKTSRLKRNPFRDTIKHTVPSKSGKRRND